MHADVLQCKPAEAVAACTITLNLTASGAYLVDVLQEGLPVSCHVASPCSMPLALTILPQPAVTKLSYFAGPGSFTHIADQPLSIAMYLRDEHGNAASAEGASLMFQASDGSFIRANLTQVGVPHCCVSALQGLVSQQSRLAHADCFFALSCQDSCAPVCLFVACFTGIDNCQISLESDTCSCHSSLAPVPAHMLLDSR